MDPGFLYPGMPASRASHPISYSGQGMPADLIPHTRLQTPTPSRHSDQSASTPHLAPRPQVPTRPPPVTPRIATPGSLTAPSISSPRPVCRVDPFSTTPHAGPTNSLSVPSTPAVPRRSPLAPHGRTITPINTPRSRLFALPSTPRALPSRPLFRSVSTPTHPSAHSAPLEGRAPPFAQSNVSIASAPGSRSGTPSPLSRAPNLTIPALRRANPAPAPASGSPTPPRITSTPSLRPHAGSPDIHLDPTPGVEGDSNFTPNVHRVRTPPPLAQPYNRVIVSNEVAEASDGFIIRESEQQYAPLRVELMAPITPRAPTTAELAIAKAKEIRHIQSGRKSKQKPDAATVSSGASDRIMMGSFSKPHQGYMAVMKAHFLWDYITRSPWSEDEEDLIKRAKSFANAATGMRGDTICTDAFTTTVSNYFKLITHTP